MKNLKDILNSKNFTTKCVNNNIMSKKTADFISESTKLRVVKDIIPAHIGKYVFSIFPSKTFKGEIAVGFDSQPACEEFNRFYNNKILKNIMKSDKKESLGINEYIGLRGWVRKENLQTYNVVMINEADYYERARGNFRNLMKGNLYKYVENLREVIAQNHDYIRKIQSAKPAQYKPYNLSDKTDFSKLGGKKY